MVGVSHGARRLWLVVWPRGGARAMVLSAHGFLAGKAASMGLGFAFWVLAARLYPAEQVGLAGAAIAATMLVVQLSLLGIEQSVIARFPAHAARPWSLLAPALATVACAALCCALLLLAAARALSRKFEAAAADPGFAALFVAMAIVGVVGAILDRASMAGRRGHETAVRNTVNGLVTIAPLAVASLGGWQLEARELFGSWVLGSMAAVAVGLAQVAFRRVPGAGRAAAAPVARPHAIELLRESIGYYALALAQRLPAIALPIAVTETVSPEANAYWYPVWMMAWASYVVPFSYSMALFAEGSHDGGALARRLRQSLRSALATGGLAALGVAVVGGPMLRVMGERYFEEGWAPLGLLLAGVFPLTLTETYYAVCRASRRVTEAVLASATAAVLALAAAAAGGLAAGLVGFGAGWTASQVATGAWAAWRTRDVTKPRLSRGVRPPAALDERAS